jgi:pSer/pThr/pTyr-binding forkhead associated (FHA) protein
VEPVDTYRELADELGESAFVRRFPHLFLLRRPPTNAQSSPPIAYRTARANPRDDVLLEEEAEEPTVLRVAAVKKRPKNPFPERITVGRAPNCDIVLRVAFISKVHATFLQEDGVLRLADNQSANGTKVNGQALGSGAPVIVSPGDNLAFGAYLVELVDAARLFRIVRASAAPT